MDVASFSAELQELQARALASIAESGSPAALDEVESGMLGRKGELRGLMGGIGALPAEDRPKIGAMANLIAPYPTLSEASKRVAGSYYTGTLFGSQARRLVRALQWLG